MPRMCGWRCRVGIFTLLIVLCQGGGWACQSDVDRRCVRAAGVEEYEVGEEEALKWAPAPPEHETLFSNDCTIRRHDGPLPTAAEFDLHFRDGAPVIFSGVANNTRFRAMTDKEALLWRFGDEEVVLSTANTHSYKKQRKTLSAYVTQHLGPRSIDDDGASALYWFGDNDFKDEWVDFYEAYERPAWVEAKERGSISFGLGGSGSGVPFHTHGPVFSEVLHGYKRWFLAPPGDRPPFEPDTTSFRWLADTFPKLRPGQISECTLGPGELLWIGPDWWHSTLNIGESVFISVFV